MKQLTVKAPAQLQAEIDQLKQTLPLPDLMDAMGFGDYAKSSCCSPFRDDKNPSFGIYRIKTGWLYQDHGSSDIGDELQFIATIHELDRRRDLAKIMGIYRTHARSAPTKKQKPIAKIKDLEVNLNPSKFVDTAAYEKRYGLLKPPRQALQEIAQIRPYGFQGLLWASERGVLKYRNGCYYVVDKTANAIEGRQVNNKPFNQGMKSKALPGSKKSWPIGILEAAGFRNIALVEGIPDFLIAHHIIQTEQPEPNCAPVGMLGSSPHIHGAAVEHFVGKSVRIFAHDDPAGRRAASRWSQQLTEAGCQLVEVYELSAFAGVNDLYDYWSQHEALSGKWMPNT